MKRNLDTKRELLDEWIAKQELMQEMGADLATLEYFDDNQAVARLKRNNLILREFLITFFKEEIEPIRIANKK